MHWQSYKIQASDSAHGRMLEREAVILQLKSGDYFSLDEVGAFIWNGITRGPISFRDLHSALVAEYDGEDRVIAADLESFCQDLLAEELIELV